VATDELSDDQLDADFLALGAVGVSDSASSGAYEVNPDFDVSESEKHEASQAGKNDASEPAPLFGNASDDVVHADASTRSTRKFQRATAASGPPSGEPWAVPPSDESPRNDPQTDFREAQPANSPVPGARVTANRAAWLTGQIEPETP